MTRLSISMPLIAVALCWMAAALPVTATCAGAAEGSGQVLGTWSQGNTTIVFESADTRDIHMGRLRTWDDFAAEHSEIARAIAYKPWLINDAGYLRRHPELSAFFQAHPRIREAMMEDVGNFAAIPPRPGE
jgi:hypothetical protein